jgi:hypothetical protein
MTVHCPTSGMQSRSTHTRKRAATCTSPFEMPGFFDFLVRPEEPSAPSTRGSEAPRCRLTSRDWHAAARSIQPGIEGGTDRYWAWQEQSVNLVLRIISTVYVPMVREL